tara:strand:- start:4554 stop:4964 length:411 start_codon:yes stop_codon:yes gene_type:complete
MNNSKLQAKFRLKRFSCDQYWKLTYTLFKNKSAEDIFVSVVKSRSYEFAKKILIEKIKDDDPNIKIKNINGWMFHKNFLFNRSTKKDLNLINIKDWEDIKKCSFPNENNYLFKFHLKYITPQEIFKRNKTKIENFA